jgi:hypothetical protein
MATFFYCDHEAGPCILSERALERLKQDPARCLAHGAIVGGILRNCEDRDDARRQIGVPFQKLYSRRQP